MAKYIDKLKTYFTNFWKYLGAIIFIIFILYKIYNSIDTSSTPFIKQLNNYKNKKIDEIIASVNNRPYYGKLPPGYFGSEYVGQKSLKGDLVKEQLVEQICPMDSYLTNLEIGTSGGYVNYLEGTCSNGKKLEMLGKKFGKSKIDSINETNENIGIQNVNVIYNTSYINDVYQIGKKNIGGEKIGCGPNRIIVGYRGRAENPNYYEDDKTSDFRVKHLQFICNDINSKLDIPLSYGICGKDGEVCKLDNYHSDIYYGVPGTKVVKIDAKKIKTREFTCRPKGFFGINGEVLPIDDPLPGIDKSCYLQKKGISEEDIKKIINNSQHRLWGAWSQGDYGKPSPILQS